LTAPLLLAAIQGGVLVRSLIVAAVLITPYYLYKRRQVRQLREARAAAAAPGQEPAEPAGPRLEDVIDSVPAAADTARAEGTVTITVPAGVTVDGDEPPPGLVDALVRDALRRSGLVATAEVDTAEGRSIECRPAPGPA
jgi:hypothetical protein